MDRLFTLRLQLFRADLKRPLIVVKAFDRQAPAVNPTGAARSRCMFTFRATSIANIGALLR